MNSELDEALLAAQENPEKFESAYYELFLNSTLYIPTWDIPEQVGARVLEEATAISPVILDQEDRQYIMLFDSEERLSQWADGQEIGIAGLKGFDILNIFDKNFYFMLNVNSENLKEFSPEEVNWLLSVTQAE